MKPYLAPSKVTLASSIFASLLYACPALGHDIHRAPSAANSHRAPAFAAGVAAGMAPVNTPDKTKGTPASAAPTPLDETAKDPVLVVHATLVRIDANKGIVRRLQQEGYAVRTVEAPDLFTHSFEQSADFIAQAVRKVQKEFPGKRVRLVAACNGGVAAQYYLKNYPEAKTAISHFVSHQSAHQGTREAPLWTLGTDQMSKHPWLARFAGGTVNFFNTISVPNFTEEEFLEGLRGFPACTAVKKFFGLCPKKTSETLASKAPSPPRATSATSGTSATSATPASHASVTEESNHPNSFKHNLDEFRRASALELYVFKNYMVLPNSPRAANLDPKFGILKQSSPPNEFISTLQKTPLPTTVKATNLYSCLDYVLIPNHVGYLQGATNVVVCPWAVKPVNNQVPDERIPEVAFHFSMYYQPFVLDRIVTALK